MDVSKSSLRSIQDTLINHLNNYAVIANDTLIILEPKSEQSAAHNIEPSVDTSTEELLTYATPETAQTQCSDAVFERQISVKAITTTYSNNDINSQNIETIISILKGEIDNVNRLELRMTVVAPMKAGKSTIINATIGDKILPTRAEAMTTLPTEVIFKRGLTEPVLLLSEDCIKSIINIQTSVHEQLDKYGTSNIRLSTEALKQVQADISLSTKIYGNDIGRTLTVINDLIRIYIQDDKGSSINLLQFQNNIPRIEVPDTTMNNSLAEHNDSVGSLVIVDTPGPNEAQASKILHQIVTDELKKASIILLVFNFTSLGTEADAKIADLIDNIRTTNGDDDCLYAVINKVDERRSGDREEEALRNFIADSYRIREKSRNDGDKRIFELKARHALASQQFINEFRRTGNVSVDIKNDLGRELYYNWEKKQKATDISLSHLEKEADDLYTESGFQHFLGCAIDNLKKKVLQKCMESALTKCTSTNTRLCDYLTVRHHALQVDREKLKIEIQKLQNNSVELGTLRNNFRAKLEEIKQTLKTTLTIEFDTEIAKCRKMIQSIFTTENPIWQTKADFEQYIKEMAMTNGIAYGSIIPFLFSLGYALHKPGHQVILGGAAVFAELMIVSSKLATDGNRVRFRTKDDAEQFLNKIYECCRHSCEETYVHIHNRVDTVCQKANNELHVFLQKGTCRIPARVKARLHSLMDMKITTDSKSFDAIIEELKPEPIKPVPIVSSLRNWVLHIFTATPEKDDIERDDTEYYVSRRTVEETFTQTFENAMERIQHQIILKCNNDLHQAFDDHFKTVQNFLEDYQDIIHKSLNDKNRSKEDKQKFVDELQELLRRLQCEKKPNRRISC